MGWTDPDGSIELGELFSNLVKSIIYLFFRTTKGPMSCLGQHLSFLNISQTWCPQKRSTVILRTIKVRSCLWFIEKYLEILFIILETVISVS